MTLTRDQIREAYIAACLGEIQALKPGNVHRFADGHRMTATQFLDSAAISAGPLTDPALRVGRRIRDAVAATRAHIGTNTNLGILLLSAPLARAAEYPSPDLRLDTSRVLDGLDHDDARDVFAAIMLAQPGGLGSAEKHDVSQEPQVGLKEAMQEAAHRDMIARQYVTGFADIFDTGLSAHAAALARGEDGMWPIVFVYLDFLSRFPDSHVVRKHGTAIAENVRAEAEAIRARVLDMEDGTEREKRLLSFDTRLKADGINPGTSADLTVATLFAKNIINLVLHNREVSG
ncbi:triphosphoribosyl-dephospho-CoA synthase [Paramesorhizobium deserti]|uniref:Triphosphoribosyl-dephospho-CoA synthase n=1 Tax=Paramesorhizobium deserti TaxID=1494590 RepID=A0A135HWE5_9HYPH|nr:triphosphoribosyl-dephospho-CoA synthase [Paramesorhizobium deserti]KXF77517.1 triphosphoribosyl-dephospho-CoA synthase [Paramesorhizobium deserti]